MTEYTVDYDVYAVGSDDDWHEYRVHLLADGDVVSQWDSKHETYTGVESHRLSEQSARNAAEDIKSDIEEDSVDPSHWFDV